MQTDPTPRTSRTLAWLPAAARSGTARRWTARLSAVTMGCCTAAALAACGSSAPGSSSTTGAAADTSASAAPNGITGQTLTLQYTEPTSLNPALSGIQEIAVVFQGLAYDSLVYQEQNGSFVPDLAVNWGYVAGSGNKSFQLTLRSGVKFSDGSALTAQATANSLEYFKKAHGPQSNLLSGLSNIKVTGPLTLTLNFATATPDLPFLLSQSENVGAIIGPAGVADPTSLNTQSDGTGPYTLSPSGVIANNQYTYQANPGYWNKNAVHYRTVVVKVIDDPNTIVSSVQQGEVDAALQNLSPSTEATAKAAGLTVLSTPYAISSLVLADRDGTISPLGKLAVRQAINDAIDRSAVSQAIAGVNAAPTDQVAVSGAPGYDASLNDYYSYDVRKAKSLLAQAGYPNGFVLPVLDSATLDPNSVIGQAMVSQLQAIGIQAKLTVEPTFAQFIPAAMSKKYPAIVLPMTASGTGFYYAMQFILGGFFNPFGVTSPQLTSLLHQVAVATSTRQQSSAAAQVNDWLVKQAWFAPITPLDYIYLIGPKVAGVQNISPSSSGTLNPTGPLPALSLYSKA